MYLTKTLCQIADTARAMFDVDLEGASLKIPRNVTSEGCHVPIPVETSSAQTQKHEPCVSPKSDSNKRILACSSFKSYLTNTKLNRNTVLCGYVVAVLLTVCCSPLYMNRGSGFLIYGLFFAMGALLPTIALHILLCSNKPAPVFLGILLLLLLPVSLFYTSQDLELNAVLISCYILSSLFYTFSCDGSRMYNNVGLSLVLTIFIVGVKSHGTSEQWEEVIPFAVVIGQMLLALNSARSLPNVSLSIVSDCKV